jgi:hypothetical protein
MQTEDLQQIKKVIDESLDKKLEERLKANNEKIFQHIDSKVDELARITNSSVQSLQNGIEGLKSSMEQRPTRQEFSNWADEEITPTKRDVDKLKFLHKDEWKELPDSGTVSRVLVEQGIKS